MARQVQFRRGTTAQTNSFTGAVGEVTVDTDKDTVVIHDGSTAGGHAVPTSLADLGVTSSATEINALDGIPATLTATELGYVDGVTSALQTQLDAKQPLGTIAVTVAGGKFVIDGTSQQTIEIKPSVTYRFDQSDGTNASHPLRFSTNDDNSPSAPFTTGVTTAGTAGSAGAYTQVKLEQDAPAVLYYYCSNHSGMGGKAIVRMSDLTASRALTSDAGGDIAVSTVTTTELGYVSGVTSAIQTQLGAKQALDAELTELATMGSTTASALADLTQAEVQILDGATVTTAELNYVDGVTSAIQTQLDAKMAPTYTGDVDITGELIVDSYNETYGAVTSSSNATTVNCEAGNAFSHTLTENTTFTFSNPPASGTAYSFSIEIIQDGSASGFTVTWPAATDWPSATAPTLTATASAKDVFVFYTRDGGTNWYGFTAGQALG